MDCFVVAVEGTLFHFFCLRFRKRLLLTSGLPFWRHWIKSAHVHTSTYTATCARKMKHIKSSSIMSVSFNSSWIVYIETLRILKNTSFKRDWQTSQGALAKCSHKSCWNVYSWPSVSAGSASMESTNLGSKTFGKKFQKVPKSKTWICPMLATIDIAFTLY